MGTWRRKNGRGWRSLRWWWMEEMVDNTEMEELEVVEEELEVLQPHPKQLLGELSREVTRTATINRPVRTPLVSKSPEGILQLYGHLLSNGQIKEVLSTHEGNILVKDSVAGTVRVTDFGCSFH
ncbi:uncharacterized protein LOC144737722 [Lampetra planeri]